MGSTAEVTINDLDDGKGNEALNLAAGKTVSYPPDYAMNTITAEAVGTFTRDGSRVFLFSMMSIS